MCSSVVVVMGSRRDDKTFLARRRRRESPESSGDETSTNIRPRGSPHDPLPKLRLVTSLLVVVVPQGELSAANAASPAIAGP